MYRYVQKYSKKIMAVLSIVLMVIFVVQQATSSSGRSSADGVIGHMGETDLLNSDLQRARNEWDLLAHNAFVPWTMPPRFPGMPPQTELVPVVYTLGGDISVGQAIVDQIRKNPELYLLLLKEAQQMGVQISVDSFESAMRNRVRARVSDTQAIPVADLNRDAVETQQLRYALMRFMQVQAAFERAAATIKVSVPERDHAVAEQFQRLTMDVIQFPDSDYEAKVPAPTQSQVEEQFKTYADVSPGLASKTNPFGFGYKYPDRVKLQYIQIPRADLVNAAEAKRNKDDQSRYEWKKDAYVFYSHNQDLFATTQPAAGAATTQSAFSVTSLTGKTGPTTQPFDQVIDRAQRLVIQNDADKLAGTIEQRLNAILNEDYIAYSRALSSTSGSTSAPASIQMSSLGVPFTSYEYLQKLAQTIQKEFVVLPQTTALDHEFHGEKDLASIKGVGGAYYKSLDFARYAVAYAKALAPEDQLHTEAQTLELWEPSQPLRDDHSDLYIFRLTAA